VRRSELILCSGPALPTW